MCARMPDYTDCDIYRYNVIPYVCTYAGYLIIILYNIDNGILLVLHYICICYSLCNQAFNIMITQ